MNNAGRSQRGSWEEIQLDVDKDLFEVDVFSTIALSRLVCKYFLEQGRHGHFAVTSSIAGKVGVPMSASYTAAKHALHVSTICLALHWGGGCWCRLVDHWLVSWK